MSVWRQTHMHDFLPLGSEKVLVAAVGTISGGLTFFFGLDTKPLIIWLAIFVAADLLTGMVAALVQHEFESKLAALWLLKKGLMFVVIGFAHGLDQQFAYTLDYLAVFQGMVIAAYGFNEVISVIENLDRMGLGGVIPPIIRKVLRQINAKLEDSVDRMGAQPKGVQK